VQPDERTRQLLLAESLGGNPLDEPVGGQPVGRRLAVELDLQGLEQGGVEDLVRLLLGTDRPGESETRLGAGVGPGGLAAASDESTGPAVERRSLRAGLMLCLAEIFCIALVAWRLQKSALERP